jgi:Zn-dependent peptidase ImmA (M78 family)/DNA-binding XRE family transcriptional regulator
MSIGGRLKQARRVAGLSLRDLADQVGVSAMAISKYERDLDVPSSGVLLRLARGLGVKTEYFFRARSIDLTVPTYRKRCSLRCQQEQAVMGQVQEWLERYFEVENLLSLEPLANLSELVGRYPVNSMDDVERAAEDLRDDWNLGTDPIENLMDLLEDRGVKVGLVEAEDEFDACTFWVGEEAAIIAVKRGVPGDRQRFNLAHELGHIVLSPGEGLDAEKAAHRFAGAFLVPAAVVRQELGQQRRNLGLAELLLLKRKYGLSAQAWVYRARDLGIVTPAAATALFRNFGRMGWRRQEPGAPVPEEAPMRMERLVLRGLAEDLISEARAAELLGRPVQRFLEGVECANDYAGIRR